MKEEEEKIVNEMTETEMEKVRSPKMQKVLNTSPSIFVTHGILVVIVILIIIGAIAYMMLF
ncbi:MAG: hypothetical protein IJ200_03985 [Prevotella sp.]|nr:hypothetical protein [Prevotella sp.]